MATDERNNAASELPSLGARLDSFAARADSFLEMNDAEKAAFLQGMSDATDEVLREQDRVVLMALLNEAYWIRQDALEIISRFGLSRFERHVVQQLDVESDPLVLVGLVEACSRLRPRSALPALRRLLAHDDAMVRSWSAEAIGFVGERDDLVRLREILATETQPLVRSEVLAALVRLGDPDALSQLEVETLAAVKDHHDGRIWERDCYLDAVYGLSSRDSLLEQRGAMSRVRALVEGVAASSALGVEDWLVRMRGSLQP